MSQDNKTALVLSDADVTTLLNDLRPINKGAQYLLMDTEIALKEHLAQMSVAWEEAKSKAEGGEEQLGPVLRTLH